MGGRAECVVCGVKDCWPDNGAGPILLLAPHRDPTLTLGLLPFPPIKPDLHQSPTHPSSNSSLLIAPLICGRTETSGGAASGLGGSSRGTLGQR